jgi:hypothetical protein
VISGVDHREIYEGVGSDSRLPQAEKRQGGVITEGGGGGGTGGAKLVMGMSYFLDDHGTVIIGFEFGIKGNVKIDETVNDLDDLDGIPGTRAPGYRSPRPWSQGIFLFYFIFYFGGSSFFSQKIKKTLFSLCFFSFSLSFSLSLYTHFGFF